MTPPEPRRAAPTKGGRRFHHKSRYGCAPCKQRKVKCDEKKPVCGNCSQRSMNCTFLYLEPTKTPQNAPPKAQKAASSSSSSSSSLELSLPPQVPNNANAWGSFCRNSSRDLELYCHFQIFTAPTFAPTPPTMVMFRDDIPNLTVPFPFVGHGLLSIAYTHLASLSPNPGGSGGSAKLLTEAAFHINKALPGYLGAIRNITRENSSALFTFAIFVVLFTFASADDEFTTAFATRGVTPVAGSAEMRRSLGVSAARVVRSIQNIFAIFWRCQQWISSSPLAAVIRRYSPPVLNEPRMTWVAMEDQALGKIGRLWAEDPAVSPELAGALAHALQCLRETFAMVTQLTDVPVQEGDGDGDTQMEMEGSTSTSTASVSPSSLVEIHKRLAAGRLDDVPCVFTWYIRLSPEFITAMEQGNLYVMVVVAHYGIVLERACADKWWTHRLASHFVTAAEWALGEERRAWIEWPLALFRVRD